IVIVGIVYFFFSSRRRHTRLQGDWSSDVCSSDLAPALGVPLRGVTGGEPVPGYEERHQRRGNQERASQQAVRVTPVRLHDEVLRSEERRVGKECRSRWWACDGKGKGNIKEDVG